ncbi:MAG: M24 family metallopeptidase [Anaerolineae bacterium]|nr:M24 family metallopeptidase [Anaerolineae bacterium]
MAETDLDLLLVNSNEADFANVRYFSNYWPVFETAGVLIPREGDAILLIGPESETYARDRSTISEIRLMKEYRESADPDYPGVKTASFREVCAAAGVPDPRHIGIAGYLVTTLPVVDSLRSQIPQSALSRADDIMVRLRSIKSPYEIVCLARAFAIAELAISTILERIKPGLTELQIVGIAQEVIYANGAEYEGMPQYVLAGSHSNHAISRPTHNVLQQGDLVQLNISARVDGYSSGVGRPVCLGKMPPAMREMTLFGKEAHEQTISWLQAGANAAQIATRYHQFFVDRGYGGNFLYGPCHGLGMMEVEPPWMEITSDYALAEDMTFQVDTFVQAADFGLRWENGAHIKADGVHLFSGQHMSLLEID